MLYLFAIVGSQNDNQVRVKIADLGNACWVVRLVYKLTIILLVVAMFCSIDDDVDNIEGALI